MRIPQRLSSYTMKGISVKGVWLCNQQNPQRTNCFCCGQSLVLNPKDKNFPRAVLVVETWPDPEFNESETIAGLICPSCQICPNAPANAISCCGINVRAITQQILRHIGTVH